MQDHSVKSIYLATSQVEKIGLVLIQVQMHFEKDEKFC